MSLSPIDRPSPNFEARAPDQPIDMLVLHYTGMASAAAALDQLCDSAAKVSAHYLIDEDGALYCLVDETARAWHAGVSCWRGNRDLNSRSIGVELVNPGHEFGYRPVPDRQIESVIALAHDILARHPIPQRNVVGHSDIAPSRKQDPGELFDWRRLARAGIGLWPEPVTGVETDLTTMLAEYGYETSESGAIEAFQRHFQPNNLTGIADSTTAALAAGLLRLID